MTPALFEHHSRRLVGEVSLFPLHGWHVPVVQDAPTSYLVSELEIQVFMFGLVLAAKPKLVIETGCDTGVMTRALASAVACNQMGRVLSCDVDYEAVMRARKLCEGLPVDIERREALSLPIEEADILFIDSSNISRALELNRVKSGAVAVVHDTFTDHDLKQACSRFARRIEIVTPRGFTILQIE